MKDRAIELWKRAKQAIQTSRHTLEHGDFDAAASRAYYAAFYAVSALFCLEGRTFKKHTAVEAAVHRDLINTGRWPKAIGPEWRSLQRLRDIGDYGGIERVSPEQARDAIVKASEILELVRQSCPDVT